MIVIVIIIAVLVLLLGIGLVVTRKKSCSCIGKPCGTDDGCGNTCCDPSKGQKCVNGKCCDASCDGLSCNETNGCGESCADIVCGDKICYQGNCCTQNCIRDSCSESCGKPCPCPNPGDICHNGECCTPPDCSTGICGNESKCGKTCTCQNDYCPGDGCCVSGKCTYKNICETSTDSLFNKLLKDWAQFCNPIDDKSSDPQCMNCDLQDALFEQDGDYMSIIPTSGTISCQQCLKSGKFVDVDPVKIDAPVNYYENNNGEITPGPRDLEQCKNQPGGCSNCLCSTSADCKRWGCDNHDCIGMKCQART